MSCHGITFKSRKDLFRHLDKLHRWIASRGKVLKVIRSGNEFVKAVVNDWLHDKHGIRILPSISYEHDTVRTVERANQTMDNTITKMLDLPPRNKHLSRQHWAMAFMHALKIKNRLPTGTTRSVTYWPLATRGAGPTPLSATTVWHCGGGPYPS